MDQQRPLLYLILIFLGFLIWNQWQMDNAPKPPATTNEATVLTGDGSTSTAGNTDIPQAAAADPSAPDQTAPPTGSGAASAKNVRVITDTLQLIISTRGGDIIQAALPTYPISIDKPDEPILIFDPSKSYLAQSGLVHRKVNGQQAKNLAPNHYANFSADQDEYRLADGEDTLLVPLTWQNDAGITVTKTFTLKRGKFSIDIAHKVDNQSGQDWQGFEYRQLRHGPAESRSGMMGGVASFNGGAFYDYRDEGYHYEKIPYDDFSDKEDGIDNKTIKGGWAAMLQRHFLTSWVPQQEQNNTYFTKQVKGSTGEDNYLLGLNTPVTSVASGAEHTFSTTLYVGPKTKQNLDELAQGLDLAIDYGWLSFLSKPLFWILKHIHDITGNWGWSIVLITVLIKLVFFYPSAVSYRSMAKLKKLTPMMKQLQERYKNDPQSKQKAMMEFYRKEKINPMGGCLPMLIQIPVFMALYFMLMESVELRQAPWILWYKDLSIMDPYLVLPILMGISMWVQHKLNPPQMDEMQKKIFAWLPWVFTVLFLWFPAGLVLYWVVNNVLSIAQQWFINKKILGDDAK